MTLQILFRALENSQGKGPGASTQKSPARALMYFN